MHYVSLIQLLTRNNASLRQKNRHFAMGPLPVAVNRRSGDGQGAGVRAGQEMTDSIPGIGQAEQFQLEATDLLRRLTGS